MMKASNNHILYGLLILVQCLSSCGKSTINSDKYTPTNQRISYNEFIEKYDYISNFTNPISNEIISSIQKITSYRFNSIINRKMNYNFDFENNVFELDYLSGQFDDNEYKVTNNLTGIITTYDEKYFYDKLLPSYKNTLSTLVLLTNNSLFNTIIDVVGSHFELDAEELFYYTDSNLSYSIGLSLTDPLVVEEWTTVDNSTFLYRYDVSFIEFQVWRGLIIKFNLRTGSRSAPMTSYFTGEYMFIADVVLYEDYLAKPL